MATTNVDLYHPRHKKDLPCAIPHGPPHVTPCGLIIMGYNPWHHKKFLLHRMENVSLMLQHQHEGTPFSSMRKGIDVCKKTRDQTKREKHEKEKNEANRLKIIC